MEDIGITCLSEVRRRDEVNGEGSEGEKRQKIEEEPEDGGGGGGGLLDNLLAKLSSPTPTPTATASDHPIDAAHLHDYSTNGKSEDGVESGVNGDDGDGGGTATAGVGVFNNIISSIFHRGGGVDEGENGKHDGDQGKIQNKKVEEASASATVVGDNNKDLAEDNNGGRQINGGTIISNLLPDDVAPASDEASILIHSVVHD